MIKYSSLQIIKKLTEEVVPVIHQAYETRTPFKEVGDIVPVTSYHNSNELGTIMFFEKEDGVYFILNAYHPELHEKFKQTAKWELDPKWLLPFSFEELNVENRKLYAFARIEEGTNRLLAMPHYAQKSRHNAMERLFGVPHQTMLNMGMTNLLHPDKLTSFLFDGHAVDINHDYVLLEVLWDEGISENDIKMHINQEVKRLKQQFEIPHWVKPKQRNGGA